MKLEELTKQLSDIDARIAPIKDQLDALRIEREIVKTQIAELQSPFKVGEKIHMNGKGYLAGSYQVDEIKAYGGDKYILVATKLKKDGERSLVVREIYYYMAHQFTLMT